ncbi:MAG: thioredoxin family protein [Acidobacteriia bacterium]|nr:thioredoxin family protein [Terriglobia bacterium]
MRRSLFIALATGAALLIPFVLAGRQAPEELTREKIFAAGQEWQDKYDKYEPAADMVDALKTKLGADMKIDVYLGLWCPDSRNNVPLFIKILDRLGTEVPVRYFGVPRKANKDVKYYVEEMKVERVPSFIFYRDGEEIGRIVEKPKTGLLEDIMDIVFK